MTNDYYLNPGWLQAPTKEALAAREETLRKMEEWAQRIQVDDIVTPQPKDPIEMGGGFWRRVWDDQPARCGCPLSPYPCVVGPADGEDRLCSHCRTRCRPDDGNYSPPKPFIL